MGLGVSPDRAEVARGYASLSDAEARRAFIETMRAVIDYSGQRVSARDRLYLTATMPSLIVWGGRDRIIPAAHGREAHEEMPGSRLEIFESAGHFPHVSEPDRFAALLAEFIAETEPAAVNDEQIREVLLRGAPA